MVSKCKHTKEDDQQTNAGQYTFIALLFHIQGNANTALTASKHNTSTEFLQETGSFYWHNTLMHKCPKTCQSYGMFGKSDALNAVLCFQRKFNCSPYPNSAIKLPIQTSELIKKHTHKCTIPDASHPHEKMLQTQSTSLGNSHTYATTRKSCQTMCIINHIPSHMHGCANWCHETSSTLSMDNWLNPTLWPSFLPPSHAFIWITSLHSSQITLLAAFTSAPFWRRISTTSLCPWNADVYKGQRPSWGINHGQQMQKHKKTWSANKCSTISIYCPSLNIQENANIAFTVSEHNTSIGLLQETCSFYWHNTLMHKCPKTCQSHGMFGKSNALIKNVCFQRKFKCSPYSNSAIKLPIQPSELIKKHAHKCPIPGAGHLH